MRVDHTGFLNGIELYNILKILDLSWVNLQLCLPVLIFVENLIATRKFFWQKKFRTN